LITAIIVDDDKNTVDVFSEYLTIKGINVVGKGYNGKDAVELYTKFRPDIVFLDVMMDEFDGIYGLEEIKKVYNNANVVMVTADLRHDTYLKLTSLNASSIIFKPYDINAIMKTIRDLTCLVECMV